MPFSVTGTMGRPLGDMVTSTDATCFSGPQSSAWAVVKKVEAARIKADNKTGFAAVAPMVLSPADGLRTALCARLFVRSARSKPTDGLHRGNIGQPYCGKSVSLCAACLSTAAGVNGRLK